MTTLDPKAAPETLRIGWFDRLLMSPTLVHYDILAKCPEGDARVVRFLSILMCLSFCWEVILFSNAAHIMLASDGTWHIGLFAVAVLMGFIVLLADAIVFIAGSWHTHGLAEVERTHEFKLPRTRVDHAKGGALIGGRFVMALLIANFMALTTGLLAFEKDIDRILKSRYLSANAILFSEGAQREDTELQKNKAGQQERGGLVLQAEAEEKSLRALSLEPKVDDSELKLALQRVASAQATKVAADADLKSAEVHSARERGGECRVPGVSCIAGEGPLWRAAQERIAASEREAAAASRALVEAQRSLRELSDARNSEARRKEAMAQIRLAEVTARKGELERQIAALAEAYGKRLASRESSIRAAVESDPRYVPRADGLLARLQALNELSKDESIAHALYGFDAILILLELAAIMGKTFALIPMTYATRMVELDLAREIETAKRLKALITGKVEPVPAPPEPVIVKQAEPEPVVTAAPVSTGPQPLNGAGVRARRHAVRWRPDLKGGPPEPQRQN
jgi:hypothetical protein